MAFLTESEFRTLNVTAAATEIKTELIEYCLSNAIAEITELAGADAAAVVIADNGTGTDASVNLQVTRFRAAQDKLAMRELLMKFGGRMRSSGILQSERDLNDSSQNSFEKFADTELRREVLLREARQLLANYILEEEVIDANLYSQGSSNIAIEYVF